MQSSTSSPAPVRTFTVPGNLAEADARVREALKTRGFGILTEVDVQATLRQKLEIETSPYRILGACNPRLAHAALTIEPRVGAFLPCGVALYEDPSGQTTTVALQDPGVMSALFAGLDDVANEASTLLAEALATVGKETS